MMYTDKYYWFSGHTNFFKVKSKCTLLSLIVNLVWSVLLSWSSLPCMCFSNYLYLQVSNYCKFLFYYSFFVSLKLVIVQYVVCFLFTIWDRNLLKNSVIVNFCISVIQVAIWSGRYSVICSSWIRREMFLCCCGWPVFWSFLMP